jgi:SAM-dependent methyltransferase
VIDMNQQNLADREWEAPVWGNYQTNMEFLHRVGLLDKPGTILEVGCGKGMLLKALQAAGHTALGIDIDPAPIAVCRSVYPELAVEVASGDSIPFPAASFDVVVSFDVFEHIRDSDRHLREVARVLKPGACYLLQTPNKWTNIPFELLRQWRKYRVGPLAGYRELLKEHCALHNYWQLKRRLDRNGFRATVFDIPVVNEYFIAKMHTYFGALASPLLAVLNPDRLPQALRTNFYVKAELTH